MNNNALVHGTFGAVTLYQCSQGITDCFIYYTYTRRLYGYVHLSACLSMYTITPTAKNGSVQKFSFWHGPTKIEVINFGTDPDHVLNIFGGGGVL